MRAGVRRLVAGATTLMVMTPAAAPARTPGDPPVVERSGLRAGALERAEAQLEEGEFEQAVATLEQGLDAPDVGEEQLIDLYRLLGLAQLYLGREDEARKAFEKLLTARPDFELSPREPPKIQELYAQIRRDIRARRVRPVKLDPPSLGPGVPGRPLEVRVKISGLSAGEKAKIYYRRAGSEAFSSVDFTVDEGERFVATLPAYELPAEPRPYELEYYLEIADAAKRRLAGKGDAYTPLSLTVRAGEEARPAAAVASPWYASPWVWVGAGALAAGATAAVVALSSTPRSGTLPVRIRLEGP